MRKLLPWLGARAAPVRLVAGEWLDRDGFGRDPERHWPRHAPESDRAEPHSAGEPATRHTEVAGGGAAAVRRIHPVTAGQAMTVPLTVVDSYSDWPTFVGRGPS